MKKYLLVMLAIVLSLLMLVACGDGDNIEEIGKNGSRDESSLANGKNGSRDESSLAKGKNGADSLNGSDDSPTNGSSGPNDFNIDELIIDPRLIGQWELIESSYSDEIVPMTLMFFDDGVLVRSENRWLWSFLGNNVIRVDHGFNFRDLTFEITGDALRFTNDTTQVFRETYTWKDSFLNEHNTHRNLVGRWDRDRTKWGDGFGHNIYVLLDDGRFVIDEGNTSWGVGGIDKDIIILLDNEDYDDPIVMHFRIAGDRLYILEPDDISQSQMVFEKVSSSEPSMAPGNAPFLLGRWYCDVEFFPELFFLPNDYVVYHESFGIFGGGYEVAGNHIRMRFNAYPETDWEFSFDGHVLTMILEPSDLAFLYELTRDPDFDPFNYDPVQLPILTQEAPPGR